MTMQTVTAYFDDKAEAARAVEAVVSAGVSRDRVSMMAGTDGTPAVDQEQGFWASLSEVFGMDDDRHAYHEGLRRGGTIVAVHSEQNEVDRVVDVLEQHGSVDLKGRELDWRGQGWSGQASGVAPMDAVGVGTLAGGLTTGVAMTSDKTTTSVAPAVSKAADLTLQARAGDDKLQVVEERLDVGKKAVERGKVRIHSYVVETPVSEKVSLRDETIHVERRPVDSQTTLGVVGTDPFRERTIEMTETGEQAVVAKSVHVVEEVGIRKEVGQRVETVSDTVRSTKVDVDDSRTETVSRGVVDFGSRIEKDMEVVGSDGLHVGTVDGLDGGSIKLKRMDTSANGQHHLIPSAWVSSVTGRRVALSKSAADAKASWTAVG